MKPSFLAAAALCATLAGARAAPALKLAAPSVRLRGAARPGLRALDLALDVAGLLAAWGAYAQPGPAWLSTGALGELALPPQPPGPELGDLERRLFGPLATRLALLPLGPMRGSGRVVGLSLRFRF
jgi:hypothetical protein